MATKKVNNEVKQSILDAYELAIAEARQEHETEKAEQHTAWKKELARLKEEDMYQLNKEKRIREDELQDELTSRVKEVEFREKTLESRELEADFAKQAAEELQQQVDNFKQVLKDEKDVSFTQGKLEAEKESDYQIRLLDVKHKAESDVKDNRIITLEQTVNSQNDLIAALREELKDANSRVEKIANSAVTAAGNSKVTVQAAPNGK